MHFLQGGGGGEFSRCSQGRLSVKSGNGLRNEKRRNLNKTHFFEKYSEIVGSIRGYSILVYRSLVIDDRVVIHLIEAGAEEVRVLVGEVDEL